MKFGFNRQVVFEMFKECGRQTTDDKGLPILIKKKFAPFSSENHDFPITRFDVAFFVFSAECEKKHCGIMYKCLYFYGNKHFLPQKPAFSTE